MSQVQFFTVGPSRLHSKFQLFMQEAIDLQIGSISHRSSIFSDIYQQCDIELRKLLQIPQAHSLFFTASATDVWEKMLLNTVEKKSFHFIQGAFSNRFYEFSKLLHKSPAYLKVEDGFGFDTIQNTAIDSDTELICTTQNETSSGIQIPEEDLIAIKKANPNALLCTDIVSSAPITSINFDYVDAAFFSVQKAFGMPAGLGVWIANEACVQKTHYLEQKGCMIGAHNTLLLYDKHYKNFQTPSTPNVVAIYILGKIAADLNQIGIEKIREETLLKQKLLIDFERESQVLSFKTKKREHLSKTVAVFDSSVSPSELLKKMKDQSYILASGYGAYKTNQIRIANFPTSSLQEMTSMLDALTAISQ
ncbi:MAG: aminotransferase class V-fold PLP-dependent enzyme [Chitinophagaceae bacterium]